MVKFKLIVGDSATGKSAVSMIEGNRAQALLGRQIGDIIDGAQLGLAGSRVRITGGCDKDGIPMRPDIHGGAKKYVVLSGGVGFRPRKWGERQRRLVRGRMITDETYQVNGVVVAEAKAPAPGTAPKSEERPRVSKPEEKPPPKEKAVKKAPPKKAKKS